MRGEEPRESGSSSAVPAGAGVPERRLPAWPSWTACPVPKPSPSSGSTTTAVPSRRAGSGATLRASSWGDGPSPGRPGSDARPGKLSEVRRGAHTELVALTVGHDNVVVIGIAVVTHDLGAEAGQPLDLGGLVVAVQVQVHLVTGAHHRARQLEGEGDMFSAQHTEVVTCAC